MPNIERINKPRKRNKKDDEKEGGRGKRGRGSENEAKGNTLPLRYYLWYLKYMFNNKPFWSLLKPK